MAKGKPRHDDVIVIVTTINGEREMTMTIYRKMVTMLSHFSAYPYRIVGE